MTTSPTPATPSPEQKMRNVTADALRHIAIALTDPHQAKFATYYEQADHILSALQSSGCLKAEGADVVRDALLRAKRYILDCGDDRTLAPEVESLDVALNSLLPPTSHQPAPSNGK